MTHMGTSLLAAHWESGGGLHDVPHQSRNPQNTMHYLPPTNCHQAHKRSVIIRMMEDVS